MQKTILFDLDDTLITVNMDQFLPGYYELLGSALNHLGTKTEIGDQINFAVGEMFANLNPIKTLKEIFDENFYSHLGTTEEACKDVLNYFYQTNFPQLKPITNSRAGVEDLVEWAQSHGVTIAVATNPLFPKTATHQRIEWANLNPGAFEFFTTYENFHFTKPHLEYYAEVLGHLGWPEGLIIMVGDSIKYDLIPMSTMGFQTFWIHNGQDTDTWADQGSIDNLKPWLKQVFMDNKSKLANHPPVHIAILRATAGIFDTWKRNISNIFKSFSPRDQVKFQQLVSAIANLETHLVHPLWESLFKVSNYEINSHNSILDHPLNEKQDPIERFLQSRLISLNMIEKLDRLDVFSLSNHGDQVKGKFPAQWLEFVSNSDRKFLQKLVPLLKNYKIF